MSITSKILVPLGLLVVAILLPMLEFSDTHVLHPEWPAHARLHNVWQLVTNGAISIMALWRRRDAVRLAAALGAAMIGEALKNAASYAYADQSQLSCATEAAQKARDRFNKKRKR
jgi:hypothetical protein